MRHKEAFLLFSILISSLAFPATVNRVFGVDYESIPSTVGYINTSLSVSPSIAPGASAIACAGTSFTPSITVPAAYAASLYDAQLGSAVTLNRYTTCLVPSDTISANAQMNFLTDTQFASIPSDTTFSTAQFASLVSGMQHSQYEQRSRYFRPERDGSVYNVNGRTNFKADIGIFCKARLELASSTHPAYNQVVITTYLTGPVSAPAIVLPSSPTTVNLNANLVLTDCMASGRTYTVSSCGNSESVWMYRSQAGQFPATLNGDPLTISVENPFVCSNSASPQPTISAAPGATIAFSFSFVNNGIRAVNVTSIALPAGSPFSNLIITSAMPFQVAANGGMQAVTGAVTVPSGAAVYPLTLSISSNSATPDCSGAIVSCSDPAFAAVNVSTLQGIAITCGLQGHGPAFFPPESALAEANCTTGGAPVNCPELNWSTNISGASMSPAQTPAASSATPVTSTFAVGAAAPLSQTGIINVTCADASSCSATCAVTVGIYEPPTGMNCSVANHSTLFSPNDWAWIYGNCTGASGGMTACPNLTWATNITNATLVPPLTLAQVLPMTNFSTHDAPTQSGWVDAISSDIRFPAVRCDGSVFLRISPVGPDYAVISVLPEKKLVPPGETVNVDVLVRNIGNTNVTNASITRLLATNCTALDQDDTIGGLNVGGSKISRFVCSCTTRGSKSITAVADANYEIGEIDETNNQGTGIINCGSSYAPACYDYV